jgi:ABC-2 type transport system permease protein
VILFARFELRRGLRDSRFLFFLVAMPTLLYLLYSGFSGTKTTDGLAAPTSFMVAMMCYATIGSACYAIGPPLAQERASRWITQLRVMPLSVPAWLAAKLVQGAVLVVPGIVAVGVTAMLSHDVHLGMAQWLELAGALVLGSLPFSVLGLVVGEAFDGQAASSATLFIVLGLSFVGGLFIPDAELPQPVRAIAAVFPSHQLASLARTIAGGHGVAFVSAAVLCLWTLGAAVAALALQRRAVAKS